MDNEQERFRQDCLASSDNMVPYLVYESAQARSERTIKRLIIALIMTILLLFLCNVIWINEWSQYDYEDIAYVQDGTGLNSINLGSQGDVRYEPNLDYTEAETEKTE